MSQSKASRIIGIDLGTTNSSVATVGANGEPAIIPNKRGNRTTPSVVSLVELAGELRFLIGEIAQRTATSEPTNTVHGFKRFIGRRFDNPEVQTLAATLPYQVVPAPNGDAWVAARGLALSPPELSALILRDLRAAAETFFGVTVTCF